MVGGTRVSHLLLHPLGETGLSLPNSETGKGERLRSCPTVKREGREAEVLPNSETGKGGGRLRSSPTVKREERERGEI